MRLVKALRRGFAASCAAGLLGAACVDERPSMPAERTAADCAPTLRMPRSPRIVELLDDGSLRPGPPCGSANCLVGAPGAWGFTDGTTNHLVIGTGEAARTLSLPALPASPFAAQHALRGFVVGENLLGIDRGAEIEIVSPSASRRFAMPALPRGETLAFLAAVDGGVDGIVRVTRDVRRRIAFVPRATAEPSPEARAVADDDGTLVGWFYPASTAAPRATIVTTSGTTLALAPELDGARYAQAKGAFFVVAGAPPEKPQWLVSSTGATLATLPRDAHVELWAGTIYVVDVAVPGAMLMLGARGLEPLIARGPHDDVTGTPLPVGARIERLEIAADHGRVVLVQRVRLRTCTIDDRLVMIDLASKAAKTIASGDVVRLHPTFAGDRFRFVEADASYETP